MVLEVKGLPRWCSGKDSAYSARDVVQSLGREDPLEEEMAAHSRILAWKIPWTEEPSGLCSLWGRKERHVTENAY